MEVDEIFAVMRHVQRNKQLDFGDDPDNKKDPGTF